MAAPSGPSGAYRPSPQFTAVGVDAIPRGVVASVAEDRSGQLWLGTGDGLVRFDGYRFRPVERSSPNPAARNLGWVQALLGSRDGRMWIGTETDGLVRHDPVDDSVKTYPLVSQDVSPSILALAEGHDGTIWVGTSSAGLWRFDPRRSQFEAVAPSNGAAESASRQVQALLVDRGGTLWVGSWQGLSRLAPGSSRFESVPLPPAAITAAEAAGNTVQALLETSDGRIWAGTRQGAVAVIDPASGLATWLDTPSMIDGPRGAVTTFVEAPGGQLWVGRETGIDVVTLAGGRPLLSLRHDERRRSGLAGNHVTALVSDRAGAIWVGSLGGGLQRHDPNNRALWLREADLDGRLFANADARSVLTLRNGQVWVADPRGSVTVLDDGLNAIDRWQPPNEPASRIQTMVELADGTVWLGRDGVLLQLSPQRRVLRSVAHRGGLTHHLVGAADGSLWIGTQDGLHRLKPGAAVPVPVALEGGAPLAGDVFVMTEGADGGLWVGAAKGLFRVEPGASTLRPVLAEDGAGLGNPVVIGLLVDSHQRLWVDTAVAGLHRLTSWDGQRARFDAVSQRHGVVSRPFGANLLEDERGRIWSHLYVYDPTGDHLDELTAADGATLGTGWFRSYAKTLDGRLLFGGSRGLLVAEAGDFDVSTHAPGLVFSELRVGGQARPAGTFPQGLQVAPGERSFSLEFAALDYSEPDRLRYAYRLKGFDPEWITTDASQRVASYTNLDPGRYELHVRGTNRSGMWSPQELVIGVEVLPAWWQTSTFKLASALATLLLLWSAQRLYTRRLRVRQRELEARVQQRTADLNAATEALKQESLALAEASLTDPLTGLRNRRFLTQQIDADVALTLRRHEAPALPGAEPPTDADLIFFLVDIDHFKSVNDLHGHAAGDAVIRQMRDRLLEVFRDSDYLVRWGGEEFLIVARGTSRVHAADLAERARAAVAQRPFVLDDGALLKKTCSIGFCCFPLAAEHPFALSWSDTVKLADGALLQVKNHGRDGWLGLVAARAETAEALRDNARQPLDRWLATGAVDAASRPETPPAR